MIEYLKHPNSFDALLQENLLLKKELQVSRQAADITAELVAEQFTNLDIVLKELSQSVELEKTLRREMTIARKAAEAANETKSDFLANMSHEIRTPMNGIIGLTDLVLDTRLDADQKMYLQMVKNSAERLLKVINDILDFSKVEAGKLKLDPTDFDLRESLNNIIHMLSLGANKKNIKLACRIDPVLPQIVHGDSNRLTQILINLTNNAIKFTDRGSVLLSAAAVPPQNDTEVPITFSIIDTGIGIPVEKQRVIFEAFCQADSSTTRKHGGTGLGLAISSQLAALMGNKILVNSTPGKGSNFWFTCRLQKAKGTSREGRRGSETKVPFSEQKAMLQGMKILVAEDETINQTLITALLTQFGFIVTAVEDGRMAVEAAAAEDYHLILMDLQMPDMDGFEATKLIKAMPKNPPIIALTAHAMGRDRKKCLLAGMDDYLSKPINRDELYQVLIRHLPQKARSLSST